MSRLKTLRQMAGLGSNRAERVAARQIRKFRKQMAEHEQAVLLRDKILQREAGADGIKPMPFARKP